MKKLFIVLVLATFFVSCLEQGEEVCITCKFDNGDEVLIKPEGKKAIITGQRRCGGENENYFVEYFNDLGELQTSSVWAFQLESKE